MVDIFAIAEQFIAGQMESYDCSHDIHHVRRVRGLAERIARSLREVDMTVVILGAIFHDAIDHKYAQTMNVTVSERLDEIRALLAPHTAPHQIETIVKICENVGFSREKKLRAQNQWTDWHETCAEFHCVQDADRLDAMGAIGMMRCSAYSCAINRPLYAPHESAAFDHIDEKLVHLLPTLRTPLGQQLGQQRHTFLLQFRAQILAELEE